MAKKSSKAKKTAEPPKPPPWWYWVGMYPVMLAAVYFALYVARIVTDKPRGFHDLVGLALFSAACGELGGYIGISARLRAARAMDQKEQGSPRQPRPRR